MELTPQQWENVKTLFDKAIETPITNRASLLAKATPDPAVRDEVERLLAHHLESGSFLSRPAVCATPEPAPASQAQSFFAGQLLADRFRITRLIARGGMGEVYEAE